MRSATASSTRVFAPPSRASTPAPPPAFVRARPPMTTPSPPLPTPPPKARPLSCVQCRHKKIKCDRGNPCGPCSLRGEAASCKALVQFSAPSQGVSGGEQGQGSSRYDGRASDRRHTVQRGEASDDEALPSRAYMLDRLERLERRVQTLEGRSAPVSTQQDNRTPLPPPSTHTISERERISLLAEDVTMGYRGAKRRRGADMMTTATTDTMNQRTSDHVADIIYQYLALLPNEAVVRRLVRIYFDELDWFARPLDVVWFHVHLDALYASGNIDTLDVNAILPEWLACLLMTVCLSAHLMDVDALQSLHIHHPEALAESAFAGAQQVLWASNFLGDCRLEHLACVILMGLYQYDKKEQADAHWTLLGSAIKAAQNMGLSDMDDRDSGWHEADVDVAQRARRVWWTLVWFDWSHAFGHRGRYSVLATQNNTALPQNVDEGSNSVKDCEMERTINTFTIARSRLVEVYRETTDMFYAAPKATRAGSLDKHDIDDLDKRLQHVVAHLPSLYTCAPLDGLSREHGYEALFVQLNIHNRILRLHRHVQAASDTQNDGVSRSQQKCLDAALAIASLLERAKEHYAVLTRMWIVTLYAIGAGLVLFLEQRRDASADNRLERYLIMLIKLFGDNQHRSYSARNAARLLRRLRRIDRATFDRATSESRRLRSGERVLVEAIASFRRSHPSQPAAATAAINDTPTLLPSLHADASTILGALDVGLGQDTADLGASTDDFGYILDMWNEAAQL